MVSIFSIRMLGRKCRGHQHAAHRKSRAVAETFLVLRSSKEGLHNKKKWRAEAFRYISMRGLLQSEREFIIIIT